MVSLFLYLCIMLKIKTLSCVQLKGLDMSFVGQENPLIFLLLLLLLLFFVLFLLIVVVVFWFLVFCLCVCFVVVVVVLISEQKNILIRIKYSRPIGTSDIILYNTFL